MTKDEVEGRLLCQAVDLCVLYVNQRLCKDDLIPLVFRYVMSKSSK